MKIHPIAALLAVPLVLSACTRVDDEGADGEEDTELSISIDDESGSSPDQIEIGGDGEKSKFSIKTDGFALDVDLPKMTLDTDAFDINDVHLYPGSKVTGMKVEDDDDKGGKVTMNFVAPAGLDKLIAWFEEKMKDDNFVVTRIDNLLSGKTGDGDPFSLKLEEKGADETAGTLEFSEEE